MSFKPHFLGALIATLPLVGHAQPQVSLYGIADVGLQSISSGAVSRTAMQSGGSMQSRWGIRGSEDLGGGLRANFLFESRIDLTDGSLFQGTMFGGRSVVGLAGKAGSVHMGLDYNPIFFTKLKSLAFGVAPYGETQTVMRQGTIRARNAIKYDSRDWNGWKFAAIVSSGDGNPANSAAGRNAGFSVDYEKGPLWVGLATTRIQVQSDVVHATQESTLGARYDLGRTRLLANLWEFRTDNRTAPDAKIRVISLGTQTKVGPNGTVLASLSHRNQISPTPAAANDAVQLTLGYEHALSRRTLLYTHWVRVDNRNNSNVSVRGVPNSGVGTGNVSDPRAFQVGMRHMF